MSLKNKFNIIIPPQDISAEPGCLRRLANGDREAFAWVYKNYAKKVYDYALLLTNDPTQSDDIVQNLFIRLWTKRDKLGEVQNFNWYLNVMMRNCVAHYFRDKTKEKGRLKDFVYLMDTVVHQEDEDAIHLNNKEQWLQKAVEKLPARQKEVYQLQRQEGLKRDQIARKLNLSPGTVKTHIKHGMRFLKKHILHIYK